MSSPSSTDVSSMASMTNPGTPFQDMWDAHDTASIITEIYERKGANVNVVAVPRCPTCRLPGAFFRRWSRT
jgi:hypothetical protein